jgi:phosphonoacetaldehyde hydrolase
MKLKAVILDWAGTIVDHGSCGPVATLQEIFAEAGVPITVAEARQSMGIAKREHIQSILRIPRVKKTWHERHKAAPDVDELYRAFIPKQLALLEHYSELISGVAVAAGHMRSRGLLIGTTTGYTRPMLDYLIERARAHGFEAESSLCPEDAGVGRPAPLMCYLNAVRLGVYPMWAMVKIGDTPSDMEEGRNAGMWTVGVARTGNETGLTEKEWNEATPDSQIVLLAHATKRLRLAGAHYVVDSISECDWLLEEIDERLSFRERP